MENFIFLDYKLLRKFKKLNENKKVLKIEKAFIFIIKYLRYMKINGKIKKINKIVGERK